MFLTKVETNLNGVRQGVKRSLYERIYDLPCRLLTCPPVAVSLAQRV
jgi:hypothetical protein